LAAQGRHDKLNGVLHADRVPPRVGDTFAGYEIELLLGRGGMGIVYLAADASLNRRVALKLLAPEPASRNLSRRSSIRT
jgi:serine/threonine protein kinase